MRGSVVTGFRVDRTQRAVDRGVNDNRPRERFQTHAVPGFPLLAPPSDADGRSAGVAPPVTDAAKEHAPSSRGDAPDRRRPPDRRRRFRLRRGGFIPVYRLLRRMKYTGWPEPGELVVGRVDEIEDFGVFVDLLEYQDRRGLVHVSEVASGWIKNIRDHASPDERVVAKVLEVDEDAQQIDLSIKDVNDHQRREKIQEWKNEQKADNWMTLAFGEDVDDEQYAAVANELLAEFGSRYDGFEQAAIHGTAALEDTDLSEGEIETIVETARENVSVPYVNVTGYVHLRAPGPDGVDDVRAALEAAGGNGEVPEEVQLSVSYVGAPEYRVKVQAPSYKLAEDALEDSAARARAAIEDHGGAFEFHRERQTDEE
jgi:translation initiation factor 2 subunit 1